MSLIRVIVSTSKEPLQTNQPWRILLMRGWSEKCYHIFTGVDFGMRWSLSVICSRGFFFPVFEQTVHCFKIFALRKGYCIWQTWNRNIFIYFSFFIDWAVSDNRQKARVQHGHNLYSCLQLILFKEKIGRDVAIHTSKTHSAACYVCFCPSQLPTSTDKTEYSGGGKIILPFYKDL